MDATLWADFVKFLTVAFVIVSVFGIPIFLVFHNEYQKSGLVCLFSIILLLTLNADRIEAFKLWGLEAKLKQTIIEANATIGQLRDVALTMSRQIYNDIAFSGQVFTRISFDELYKNKTALDQALKNIGASEEEINKSSNLWRLVAGRQMTALIFMDEGRLEEDVREKWEGLKQPYYEKGEDVPPEKIEKFLNDNSLMSTFRKNRFEDYKHYIETGEIRHIENFPVGMGIPN